MLLAYKPGFFFSHFFTFSLNPTSIVETLCCACACGVWIRSIQLYFYNIPFQICDHIYVICIPSLLITFVSFSAFLFLGLCAGDRMRHRTEFLPHVATHKRKKRKRLTIRSIIHSILFIKF